MKRRRFSCPIRASGARNAALFPDYHKHRHTPPETPAAKNRAAAQSGPLFGQVFDFIIGNSALLG